MHSERTRLIKSKEGDSVAIRMEHVKGDSELKLTLKSVSSGEDSIITVEEYHSVVNPVLIVKKPLGYLIPKDSVNLVEMLKNHDVKFRSFTQKANEKEIQKYYIERISTQFFSKN